ncbi:general amino acid permease [Diplodia corticola]|uniref:General amino acid permease n=1 Tax=Diplodia corticola TaxID=236234 RepID=A0A1J9REJ3_9PEZI|nr:general amino acid permease [Diplodia corticola]OJD38960.1 general amino acid permease [Diplodia corticola]
MHFEGRQRSPRATPLNRELGRWQIFMIAISTIIGIGFVSRAGEILAFGGPATVLVSFALVGVVAVAVMEGISEMVVTWPVSNPLVEFVRRFVDRDFAVVVCVAYWYTWAITFAALVSTAGNIVKYWNNSKAAEALVYALCPLLVFFINFNTLFGYIELFGGVLKLLIVFMVFVIMLCLKGGVDWAHEPSKEEGFGNYIADGFRHRCQVSSSSGVAVLIGINLAVYPFVGVESVTMTAFEAKDTRELKPPTRNISFIVLSVYMISIVSMLLNVWWEDPLLMRYYDQWTAGEHNTTNCPDSTPGQQSFVTSRASNSTGDDDRLLPVIATDRFGIKNLGGVINACLLYSAFSAANSALFVASRTLYGLGSSIQRDEKSAFLRLLASFGDVDGNGVPQRAIIGSIFFAWLPFLSLHDAPGTHSIQDILQSIGTTSCILVWASQALAFLRYHWWLRKHHTELKGQYRKFDRWTRADRLSWLEFAQPWLAWFSLVASLTILFVFASAGLWSSETNAREKLAVKALDQYLGPGLLLLMFVGLKVVKRRGWVRLGNWDELRETLNDLNELVMPSSTSTGDRQANGSLEPNGRVDGTEVYEMVNGTVHEM